MKQSRLDRLGFGRLFRDLFPFDHVLKFLAHAKCSGGIRKEPLLVHPIKAKSLEDGQLVMGTPCATANELYFNAWHLI